jgi:hypothetical protein
MELIEYFVEVLQIHAAESILKIVMFISSDKELVATEIKVHFLDHELYLYDTFLCQFCPSVLSQVTLVKVHFITFSPNACS